MSALRVVDVQGSTWLILQNRLIAIEERKSKGTNFTIIYVETGNNPLEVVTTTTLDDIIKVNTQQQQQPQQQLPKPPIEEIDESSSSSKGKDKEV